MTLSISQRLALTVALLSALVLAPAGVGLFWTVKRNIETRATEQAHLNAFEVDNRIWKQLDEDILADFIGVRVVFDSLVIPFPHWAVVRADGRSEMASGLFRSYQGVQVGRPAEIIRAVPGSLYAVASTPLIPEKPIIWADLPETVKRMVLTQVPDETFLWAKNDVAGSHFVFSVQMLGPSGITEVQVTDQGQHLQTQTDPLPTSLPTGMDVRTPEGQVLQAPRIVGWRSANSELIALIQGQSPEGTPRRVAVNRFGENYRIEPDGGVGPRLETSRLWVVVAHDLSADMATVRFTGRVIVVGSLSLWSLMVLIAWLVTRHALRPINEMVNQAGKIDTSKLDERLPIGTADDELSRVGRTVNKMLDRLQEGYQREQRFTADASHEMRSPLAKMAAEIDLALSRPRSLHDYRAALTRLGQYTQGMQQLVDSLLTLTQLEGGLQASDIQPFDAADLAVEVFKTLSPAANGRIQLSLDEADRPMKAVGQRELIGALLRNLLDNALRYSPAGAPVDLRVREEGARIRFEVEDRGPGIPEEQRHLVFHRFHRLEKSRSKRTGGTGLGLSIVKAIAAVHHAEISLSGTADNGHGTLAAFTLPAWQYHGG